MKTILYIFVFITLVGFIGSFFKSIEDEDPTRQQTAQNQVDPKSEPELDVKQKANNNQSISVSPSVNTVRAQLKDEQKITKEYSTCFTDTYDEQKCMALAADRYGYLRSSTAIKEVVTQDYSYLYHHFDNDDLAEEHCAYLYGEQLCDEIEDMYDDEEDSNFDGSSAVGGALVGGLVARALAYKEKKAKKLAHTKLAKAKKKKSAVKKAIKPTLTTNKVAKSKVVNFKDKSSSSKKTVVKKATVKKTAKASRSSSSSSSRTSKSKKGK